MGLGVLMLLSTLGLAIGISAADIGPGQGSDIRHRRGDLGWVESSDRTLPQWHDRFAGLDRCRSDRRDDAWGYIREVIRRAAPADT